MSQNRKQRKDSILSCRTNRELKLAVDKLAKRKNLNRSDYMEYVLHLHVQKELPATN